MPQKPSLISKKICDHDMYLFNAYKIRFERRLSFDKINRLH